MSRYFKTTNASRPYKAGGLSFEFELVELLGGGSWLGVLAAEEPAASHLASANFPQVTELSQTDYDQFKKKIQDALGKLHSVGATIKYAPTPERACSSCGSPNGGYQVRNK